MASGEFVDDFLDGKVQCLLEHSKVGPVPGREKGLGVRAETGRVDGGEVVPADIGTAVDTWINVNILIMPSTFPVHTSDLIEADLVSLGLVHKSLHTQEVQVPLIGVPLELANLQTRSR